MKEEAQWQALPTSHGVGPKPGTPFRVPMWVAGTKWLEPSPLPCAQGSAFEGAGYSVQGLWHRLGPSWAAADAEPDTHTTPGTCLSHDGASDFPPRQLHWARSG